MLLCFGDYELDEQRLELRRAGAKVPVQPKVLDVLFHLVRARDRVVLKKELFESIWPGVVVSEASISRVIMEVRKAIDDELHQTVVTVRGRGFRFTAAVEEREASKAGPAAEPRVDPTFVGRGACLAAAEAKLDEALEGHGGILWLSGEAGIGKSRTAEEIARRARLRGATVLVAHAHETPAAPPFWLWTQLLRACGEARDHAARDALEPLVARLTAAGQSPPREEFPLFEAVTEALRAAAHQGPLLLLLDDMQWADEPSLRMLQFVARELRQARVWTVATYRDGALRGDGVARAVGDLLRERASVAIPLRGMSVDEAARFVEVVSGTSPSPEFVRALLERSGGNPLYMHQLLRTEWAERALTERAHEMASSMDLQQGLIESISRHVDSLTDATRELLTVAAVLGREFELAKLLVVCAEPQRAVLDHLDEATQARVLVKGKDGAHRFAHALVRDVLYKKLSSAERMTRHRIIGERLRAHYGADLDAHAAELARHFVRALPAGDALLAVDLAARAAERDAALGAHRDAARHWQQAVAAFGHVKGHDGRRVRVLLEMARALAAAGQTGEARAAYLDAVTLGALGPGKDDQTARLEAAVQAAIGA